MNTQILQKKKDILKQRLRILILQNAREGSVYEDKFLMELSHISEQLLVLRQANVLPNKVGIAKRAAGIVPTMVAHT